MFKFDKYTLPYHITNMIFYAFTLAVIGFIYVYIFYPPLSDVATQEFFATFGLREFGGLFFFLLLIITPLLVLFGAVHHFYRIITYRKSSRTAAE
ncbi:hypothetical protein [Salinicoccus roseus]|uniref:Uncharacterized protein n=1 Tax=Salinicoccus roseus TaxID=45670 RepID=A0A265E7M6_9STAP|nr:hypothetical protein [Salinicoccus roseus]OZT77258.1 hypothetical protein CFN03_09305 [Salinicoccus roseus]RPE55129.1 hypothetical protein EDC33_1394 [Salinicoccus roseus]GGA59917.1 hypothetical protein GCM10007176_00390 [Salinicoccus roseus]